jgi:hypothetical protein
MASSGAPDLSGDTNRASVLFQLYNVLDPRLAVDFSSVSHPRGVGTDAGAAAAAAG